MIEPSGYVFTEREYAFAGVSAEELRDMRTHRAPLGIRPERWDECVRELRDAMAADGITDTAVRLRGPGARFCSEDPRKWFPQDEDDLRTQVSEQHRNASEKERTQRAEKAVARYRAAGFSRERPKPRAPFFDSLRRLELADDADGYDFEIDTGEATPALREWASRWEGRLDRPVTLAGSPGTVARDDDWTVVDPEEGAGQDDDRR
ncbi:hypothetical protein [Actinomadura darangshiensis]|uniref:hypothetical protein n=1 Tax=Actinomadura darangshiensis TaxID=705336 RepID=UPI0010498CBC|nr:hypothetical protein [Actinomadura darangshiensis]